MENLDTKEIDYSMAQKRVRKVKKFYESTVFFILVLAAFGFWKYYRSDYSYIESVFLEFNRLNIIFWIWGVILILRAMKLFLFDQNWERKMMNKQLNK